MTSIPSAIPSAFHERAISLDHLHVAEVAWKRADVLEIMAALKNSNWAVLGGDVLRSDGQAYRHTYDSVSYTHLRAHETVLDLVCRLLLEKKKKKLNKNT